MSGREPIPLSRPVLAGNEAVYVQECIESGWITGGRFIGLLEAGMRELTGAGEAVACVSGTAGLHLALLLAGVRSGDEVVVPAVTFIAPANAVAYVGATPAFLGCDDFLGLDPTLLEEFLDEECESTDDGPRDKATGRIIRAVVAVHVFGNPCDLGAIAPICRRHGVALIEDACESVGSRWESGPLGGRHTGTVGDFGVFSFNGNKIMTTAGGGMLVTSERSHAERARYLIDQAKDDSKRYVHGAVGFNYRLSNLQAAVGVAQLEELPTFIATRRRNHAHYSVGLGGARGLQFLGVPVDTSPNYWFYSLLVESEEFGMDREALMMALERDGIETRPMWPPNHLQAPFRDARAYRADRASWAWRRLLNLPSSSDLTAADVERVVTAVLTAAG